jgi:hypothetical protein
MFGVLATEGLVAVISIFLLNLVFFIRRKFDSNEGVCLGIFLLFFVVWIKFSRTLTLFIVIIFTAWFTVDLRK